MNWERVHTIDDFHDRPVHGAADLGGVPHFYRAEFDENSDAYTGRYRLVAISPGLFKLVMEQWAIWQRWRLAYDHGEALIEGHPCLEPDQQRFDELARMIETFKSMAPTESVVKIALFRQRDIDHSTDPGTAAFEVCWQAVWAP